MHFKKGPGSLAWLTFLVALLVAGGVLGAPAGANAAAFCYWRLNDCTVGNIPPDVTHNSGYYNSDRNFMSTLAGAHVMRVWVVRSGTKYGPWTSGGATYYFYVDFSGSPNQQNWCQNPNGFTAIADSCGWEM